MLVELVVENFAVVERLRLPLHAGLNALTGETGSGKSLVVDAVSLLFGGRASVEMIRTATGWPAAMGRVGGRGQGMDLHVVAASLSGTASAGTIVARASMMAAADPSAFWMGSCN